jgi:WD40 repeat protein
MRLWDADTGEHRITLTGPTSAVLSVAYSPDGTTLASVGYDGTVFRMASIHERGRDQLEALREI